MEINKLPEMPIEADGYLLIDNGTTYKVSTDTLKGEITNNLTTTTAGTQLDARQGRILNNANTDNVAAITSLNAVIDSELSGSRSMQAFRLPGTDTDNKIPTSATDMMAMVYVTRSGYLGTPFVYTKLYNPLLGSQKISVGGYSEGSTHTRVTVNAAPGGTNSIVTAETTYKTSALNTDNINLFRRYNPDDEEE